MSLSPVALCARALMKIGAQPIQSFYDDRIEAEVALALYEPTRDALLSAYPWRFAVTQMNLPRLVDTPLADFDDIYQLPDDCLRILSLGSGGDSHNLVYRRIGNTIHTSSDTALLTYIFRPDDQVAPPYFEQVLINRLAAEFCLPLTESTSRAELLFRMSDNDFERAKRIDAQQDTPRVLDDYNLITVRD
jgi:hypothetical protein